MKLGHRPELDGLRGVAVAAVFLFHASVGLPGGWVGVDLFFVLSGFLITALLVQEHADGGIDLRAFWVRRARRLLPASLVVVAVAATMGAGGLWWVLGYGANWAKVGGMDLGPLDHFWSLAIEEQFYVVWPLVLLGLLRLRDPLAAVLVGVIGVVAWRAVVVASGAGWERLHFSTDLRVDALLIGAAAALWWRRGGTVAPVWGVAAGTALAAVVVVADPHHALYTPAAVAAAVVVLAVMSTPCGPLAARAVTSLGRVSYGVYLWHWPILWALQQSGRWGAGWDLVAACGTVAAAYGSARWIERPFRLGREEDQEREVARSVSADRH